MSICAGIPWSRESRMIPGSGWSEHGTLWGREYSGKESESHSLVFATPWTVCSAPGSSIHGDSPGKNTGVGCHALLQGIFPNQGSNPGLPHCRQILYPLSHQGSPDFPLSTALAASVKFWYVVFSFSFTLKYFLIYVLSFFDPSVI